MKQNVDEPLLISQTVKDTWFAAIQEGNINIIQHYITTYHIPVNELTTTYGENSLMVAIEYNHLKIVKYFITECHANTNSTDTYGWTCLHYAIYNNSFEIVKYLMNKCKADVHALTSDGQSCLHLAIQYGYFKLVRHLIEKCKADVNATVNGGWSCLHYAASRGNYEMVKYLIENCNADVKATTENGRTCLHYAASNSKVEMVKYLIENCNADVNATNNHGWTCLLCAASKNNFEMVQYVVENCNADVNATSNHGWTCLLCAAFNDNFDMVKYLIENCNADVNATNNDGWTCLLYAASNGNYEMVKYHIENCNAYVNATTSDGWTCLLYAASNGNYEMVKYFIETCNANINATTSDGWTCLLYAASNGNFEMVKYFIENCNANINATNNDGKTCLLCAASNGNFEVVKYLIENCHADVNATNNDGRTCLHFAVQYRRFEMVGYIINNCQVDVAAKTNDGYTALKFAMNTKDDAIIKLLVKKGKARIDFMDTTITQNFLLAVNNGDLETVQTYLDCEIDISKTIDDQQSNALHIACRKGYYDVAHCLLIYATSSASTSKEFIDAKQKDGFTALHLACLNGHFEIVQTLFLDGECNTMARTNKEATPLHLACLRGHIDIVQYLINTCKVDVNTVAMDDMIPLHSAIYGGKLDVVRFLIEESGAKLDAITTNGISTTDLAKKRDHIDIHSYLQQIELERINSNGQGTLDSRILTDPVNKTSFDILNLKDLNIDASEIKIFLKKYDHINKMVNDHRANLSASFNQSVPWDTITYRKILDTIITERIKSIDEQEEINAILSNPENAEFYIFLISKLDCVMNAFKCLSTGMIGMGNGKSLRSTISDALQGKAVDVKVVGSVLDSIKQHLSCIPGCTVIISTIQIIFSLKSEWEQLQSFDRVAEFATKAPVYSGTDIQIIWERCARLIIRAKCNHTTKPFTPTTEKFGKVKQGILYLLAESTNTPVKEQASMAADCIFSYILKPDEGCVLDDIFGSYDVASGRNVTIPEALAAAALGISIDELRLLPKISNNDQGIVHELAPSVTNQDQSNVHHSITTITRTEMMFSSTTSSAVVAVDEFLELKNDVNETNTILAQKFRDTYVSRREFDDLKAELKFLRMQNDARRKSSNNDGDNGAFHDHIMLLTEKIAMMEERWKREDSEVYNEVRRKLEDSEVIYEERWKRVDNEGIFENHEFDSIRNRSSKHEQNNGKNRRLLFHSSKTKEIDEQRHVECLYR